MDQPTDPDRGERFFLRRHRVVNAGAGTGKTHALLTQYLHLLGGLTVHGRALEPRAICALTFTEKAAGEMRERLGRRLHGVVQALAAVENSAAQAGEGLAAVEPDLCKSAQALGRELPPLPHWEAAQAQLSVATIGTFHSFAAALLRRHAVASGLDPDFALLDADDARDRLEETSERVVLAALESTHGESLAAATAQLVAEYGFRGGARAEGGVVEALCQLYWMRAEEGQGAAGLAAAYSAAQLERERERISRALVEGLRALGELASELTGKSAERAAQLAGSRSDIERGLAQLADERLTAVLPLVQSVRGELRWLRAPKDKSGSGIGERLPPVIAQLKRACDEVRPLLLSLRAAPLAQGLEGLLDVVIQSYTATKRTSAVLDFTDLLRQARDLLRDLPAVRRAEQGRYAALLVDEFQDTSPLQAELLRLLVGFDELDDSESASLRRLYLVGDRKQSIYGFRGADVTAYERLCQQLLAAGADEETLAVSRRSRPALIAGSNSLFSRVFVVGAQAEAEVGHVAWDLARDPLLPFRAPPDAAGPLIELLHSPAVVRPADGEAAPVDDPLGREALLVAERILALREAGTQYRQVVLLLRRFTHLLRYTSALKLAGIPHYVVRGRGFYQAQEVLDLAAFLTLLDDPEDRLALLSVLRSPLCGLSDESLARLHLSSSRGGLLTLAALLHAERDGRLATLLPRDEAAWLGRLLGLLLALGRCGDRLGPAACLTALLDHTDYLGVLYADADGEQRVANVLRLGERARLSESRGGTLRSFVRALRQDTDPRLSELRGERDEPTASTVSEAEDVVRVMTVHQSKGLEFPVVFVAGCGSLERSDAPAIAYDRTVGLGLKVSDDGERWPTLAARRVRELGRQRSAAESGRLFYVATTRAQERLCFVGELRAGRKAPGGSWLASLELLRAEEPELVHAWQPSGPPLATRAGRQLPSGLGSALDSPLLAPVAERWVATAYSSGEPLRVQPESASGQALGLSLAAATELILCRRRFHFHQSLHLYELDSDEVAATSLLAASATGARGEEPPFAGPPPLGTLAAELLDELDLAAGVGGGSPLAAVQSQLALRGQDLRAASVGELATRLVRFLESAYVTRELAGSGRRLWRALPYDVELSAAGVRLRGTLDLVLLKHDVDPPEVELLEYRYAYAADGDGDSPVDALRRELLRLLGERLFAGAAIRVGICYLRESDPQPRFAPCQPIDSLPARLGEAAAAVALTSPAALRLPVLPRQRCQALGCGYQYICFGS